jgi:hypothetical protein
LDVYDNHLISELRSFASNSLNVKHFKLLVEKFGLVNLSKVGVFFSSFIANIAEQLHQKLIYIVLLSWTEILVHKAKHLMNAKF